MLTSTVTYFTFIHVHTGLGIIQKLVSGWALTVEASSLVDAVMTTASIIAITFINILADLLIAGLEFESGITSTMKASSGVHTVMITSSIAIRAFIYVSTIFLVTIKKVTFGASARMTSWVIHT